MLGFGCNKRTRYRRLWLWNYEIPASNTDEGKGRIAAYYAALGHFIDAFSEVENGGGPDTTKVCRGKRFHRANNLLSAHAG